MNTHTASWKTEEETELFPLRHSIHHIVLPFLCLFSGYAYLRVIGSESGFIVLYSLLGGYSVIGATSNRQLGKPSTSKKKALLFSSSPLVTIGISGLSRRVFDVKETKEKKIVRRRKLESCTRLKMPFSLTFFPFFLSFWEPTM